MSTSPPARLRVRLSEAPLFCSPFDPESLFIFFQALPPGGIYIFASQLHTHLAGRGVRTVLVRGGRELEVVQEDKHFSTHYQVSSGRPPFFPEAPGGQG